MTLTAHLSAALSRLTMPEVREVVDALPYRMRREIRRACDTGGPEARMARRRAVGALGGKAAMERRRKDGTMRDYQRRAAEKRWSK